MQVIGCMPECFSTGEKLSMSVYLSMTDMPITRILFTYINHLLPKNKKPNYNWVLRRYPQTRSIATGAIGGNVPLDVPFFEHLPFKYLKKDLVLFVAEIS